MPSFDGSLADVFDPAGRHVRTVDGFLGLPLLTIGYDAAGRLSSVTGTVRGLPVHLEVRRADDGTPQSLAGIDGALTTVALDGDGHLATVTDPAGSTTSLSWAPGGLVTSETDALGGVTRFTYDQDGRLVASSDADGVTVQRARSETADGVEIRATTALGRTTTYQVESVAGGIRRTLTAPDGTSTVETTEADGSLTLATPDGTTRTIGTVASAGWGMAAPLLTPDGIKRPDGVTSTTTIAQQLSRAGGVPYALSGTVTTTRNGDATVRAFDPTARTAATVDPAGRRTLLTFDPNGRMVSDAAAGQPTFAATYDAAGRKSSITVGTGASARTTRFTYDPSTGIETATRPDGTTLTVGVDAQGNGGDIRRGRRLDRADDVRCPWSTRRRAGRRRARLHARLQPCRPSDGVPPAVGAGRRIGRDDDVRRRRADDHGVRSRNERRGRVVRRSRPCHRLDRLRRPVDAGVGCQDRPGVVRRRIPTGSALPTDMPQVRRTA